MTNHNGESINKKIIKLHYKDIYQILVKKVFNEEVEDFEISKYLK